MLPQESIGTTMHVVDRTVIPVSGVASSAPHVNTSTEYNLLSRAVAPLSTSVRLGFDASMRRF